MEWPMNQNNIYQLKYNTNTMNTKTSNKNQKFTDLLKPISDDLSCGINLEYDPEFLLLLSKSTEQPEAQYGDFVNTPESVNWNEVERDALRLLLRTKDIRIYILLLRSQIQLNGVAGLLEGITLLEQACSNYSQEIHPQIEIDDSGDEEEAALARANALAALLDPDGVLGDIRSIVLSSNAALRLQIRDVERSLSIPRPTDALAPESVRRQLSDLRMRNNSVLTALDETIPVLEKLQIWADETLKSVAPNFSPIKKILNNLKESTNQYATKCENQDNNVQQDNQTVTNDSSKAEILTPVIPSTIESELHQPLQNQPAVIANRFDALERIEEVRGWFETNEPSSPTIPLLRQAEKMVGKRFSEVVESIPLELLQKWDSSDS